jgi:8-oxo-dGTP diphosphatase
MGTVTGPGQAPRAVFFEEAPARAVVVRLRRDGYDAALARDRFAGEDDDEDHHWVVTSDAPEWVLDVLVEAYDGWLDVPDPAPTRLPPLELPTAPKRIRHPD